MWYKNCLAGLFSVFIIFAMAVSWQKIHGGGALIEYLPVYFRGLHICVGAMEEKTIRCYEVSATGQVLGVPPTSFNCACDEAYTSR